MGENAQLLDGRAYKGEHTGSVDVGKDVSILWRGNGLTAGGSATSDDHAAGVSAP